MKISGFTLIRNGVEFDYPFMESIRSLLPLVDELVVNVGKGTDETWERLKEFSETEEGQKLKLFESMWPLDDPEKKRDGRILSEQTNFALEKCTGDWCIYLQADEVLHEADLLALRQALEKFNDNPEVEGLLFDYVHFYGSYDVIQYSRSVYRREVRAIKRGANIKSIGDAQSFRLENGDKLKVERSGARVFHYGWVRTPEQMKQKTYFMDQLYHGDPTQTQRETGTPHTGDNYRYKRFWGLKRYAGNHPQVMRQRIQSKNWNWDFEHSPFVWSWSDLPKVILDMIEQVTGIRFFEYRSYRY